MEDKHTKETQQNANSSKKTRALDAEIGFMEQGKEAGKEGKFAHGIQTVRADVVRGPMPFPIPNFPDKNKTEGKSSDCIIS